MKKTLLLSLAAVVLAATLLTGCNTSGGQAVRNFLYRPVVVTNTLPATTVTNTVFITNAVPVIATNAAGVPVIVTNLTVTPEQRVEFLPPRQVLVTNAWEKREEVFTTAETVVGFVPGWGALAATALSALGAVGATYLSKKKSEGVAATMRAVSISSIQGLDEFRRGLQSTEQGRALDAQLTALLQRAHIDYGVLDTVKELLDEHTGYTTEPNKVGEILAGKPAAA